MKNCGNKVKNTCGEKVYATCVYYEEVVPAFSDDSITRTTTYVDADCITLEETTEDTYILIGGIKDEIDLSDLTGGGAPCNLTYAPDENGNTVVKNVLLKYEEEICLLKAKVKALEETAICNIDITGCNFTDLGVDDCLNPITTLGETLQYILTQIATP